MRQRWFSLALIVALVLAACDQNEAPPPVDWCYTYNLAVALPESMTITSGEWMPGVGLRPDETGELIVSFSEDLFIEIQYAGVQVIRLDNPGDIEIDGIASVFGYDFVIDETFPTIAPEDEVYQVYERAPEDPIIAGQFVNLTMQADDSIAINQLDVGGNGASPFSSNPCGEETPEPATPTSEASETSTPGPTLTPTITQTPSITPTPEACTWVNDADLPPDFPAHAGWGVSTAAGWTWIQFDSGENVYSGLTNPFTSGGYYIDEFRVRYASWDNSSNRASNVRVRFYDGASVIYTFDFNPEIGGFTRATGGADAIHLFSPNISSITSVSFQAIGGTGGKGYYVARFQFLVCPTYVEPTATPSPTLTQTLTPSLTLTRTSTLTRTPIGGPGDGTPTATWTPVNTNTALPSSTPIPSLPPPTAIPTVITVTPQTYTPEDTSTPNPVTSTPFGTPGGTPWGTPVEWGTPWGTPNGTAIVAGTGLPDMRLTPEYGPVYGFLSTAAAEVNSIPGQITGYIPQVDPGPLFGYVKWAASCVSAQELVGQTLSPILCHTFVGVSLNLVLAAIFMSVRVVRLFIKIVNWIMKQILRVIPTMGG
jgi:hypothetical protein